ncbi:hypothetical protein BSSX_p0070 (plasmid) [Bacillus subtilis]|nr:hypothetical protein BSSX_p0070 [Bacillus subtilis]
MPSDRTTEPTNHKRGKVDEPNNKSSNDSSRNGKTSRILSSQAFA